MARTVRVTLEADTGRYIAPVKESEAATEGLDRQVEALDRDINKLPADSAKAGTGLTGLGTEAERAGAKTEGLSERVKGTDEQLKKIPPDAAKASAALRLLGEESTSAGLKLDSLGKRSTSMEVIDQRIAKIRSEIRGLADEFNRTGSGPALQMMIGRQADLRGLERLRRDVTRALDDGSSRAGEAGASSFISSFSNVFEGGGGKAMTALIVGAIAGAFLLGNGLLLGATGLGGIAAGIVGQLHDPAIHHAFADMGHDVAQQFTYATLSFREPLVESATIFGSALHSAIASIDFPSLAKLVTPLAGGFGGLLTHMMPGVNKALEAAAPVIAAIAQELPKLGSALSDMFAKFARGKDGAVIAIKAIIDLFRVLAEVIGDVVEAGAKTIEWLTTHLAKLFHFIAEGAGKLHMGGLKKGAEEVATALDNLSNTNTNGLDKAGAAAAKAGASFTELKDRIAATAETADTLQAAMAGKLFDTIMSEDQAILGWHKSLLDLHDTLDNNGRAIDRHTGLVSMNTKAGLDNREAVLAAMTANMQQYQSFIAAGMSADEATKRYNDNTAALEDMLHKAHFTQKQIDDMIGSLRDVPKKTEAEIAMYGLTEAVNNLGGLLAELNHLNGKDYGFTIRAHVYDPSGTTRSREFATGGIVEHAATGLLRDAKVYSAVNPGRYMIAEEATGGEAFVPRLGDYGRSTAILDQAARWYGGRFAPAGAGGGVVVNVTVPVSAGLVADQAQLANMVGEQVIRSIKAGGAVRYAIQAVASGQGF